MPKSNTKVQTAHATKRVGCVLLSALFAVTLAGCDSGRSNALAMTEAMRQCSGTVSLTTSIASWGNTVTMHCDKLVFKTKDQP